MSAASSSSTGARPNGGARSNADSIGRSGSSSSGPDTQRLKDQAGRVVDDVRELGHVARDEAGHAIDNAKERGQRALEQGRERYDDYRVNIEQYVGEKPFTSILIAAGAGALLGFYMRGR